VSHCRHAASQLLFDIWLFLSGCVNSKEESPFAGLAKLTSQHPSVYLRVAHCLRDLAYGDGSGADLLYEMLNTDDPEYQQLFRDAFWRD
jgi:hypothetical protein